MACIAPTEGILSKDSDGYGAIHIVHDPWRPVPARGGHLSPQPGPYNRSELDIRTDVATFTSLPLQETLLEQVHLLLKYSLDLDCYSFG